MQTKTLTTQDIDRGVSAAKAELETATDAYNKAAYAYAQDRGSSELQDALIAAKRQVTLLEGEIAGLQGARAEAGRIEDAQEIEREIGNVDATRTRAHESIEALPPALEKFNEALVVFADTVRDLEQAERSANYAVVSLYDGTDRRPATPAFRVHGLIEALMWLRLGDSYELKRSAVVVNAAGQRNPDGPSDALERMCARARAAIEARCKSKLEHLREQAEQQQPAKAA